jgi:hypothetical protein
MRSQNLRTYLEDGIQSLMPQTQRLLELRQVLAGGLPPNLRRSCTIANYMQGKVVIFAENSAVAAKLKLMLPDLRDRFVKRAIEVTGIEIQVQPKEPAPIPDKTLEMSQGAVSSLAQLESQLADSKLKSVIAGLVEKHRSKH